MKDKLMTLCCVSIRILMCPLLIVFALFLVTIAFIVMGMNEIFDFFSCGEDEE